MSDMPEVNTIPTVAAATPADTATSEREFYCMIRGYNAEAMLQCKTGQHKRDESRKCISDYFGRNKRGTLGIKRPIAWCRMHYQRACYKTDVWQIKKVELIIDQLNLIEEDDPGTTYNIQLTKTNTTRLNEARAGRPDPAEQTLKTSKRPRKAEATPIPILDYLDKNYIGPNAPLDKVLEVVERLRSMIRHKHCQKLPEIEFTPEYPEKVLQQRLGEDPSSSGRRKSGNADKVTVLPKGTTARQASKAKGKVVVATTDDEESPPGRAAPGRRVQDNDASRSGWTAVNGGDAQHTTKQSPQMAEGLNADEAEAAHTMLAYARSGAAFDPAALGQPISQGLPASIKGGTVQSFNKRHLEEEEPLSSAPKRQKYTTEETVVSRQVDAVVGPSNRRILPATGRSHSSTRSLTAAPQEPATPYHQARGRNATSRRIITSPSELGDAAQRDLKARLAVAQAEWMAEHGIELAEQPRDVDAQAQSNFEDTDELVDADETREYLPRTPMRRPVPQGRRLPYATV